MVNFFWLIKFMRFFIIIILIITSFSPELSIAQRLQQDGIAKNDKSHKLKEPILIIQPKNMRSEVIMMVPGAKKTVYSAGYLGELGVTLFRAEEFRDEFRGGWREFRARALLATKSHLKSIKPIYVRDSLGKIEYALIQSENPSIIAAIKTSQFRDLFKDKFGDNLLVVMPNRSTIIIFSADKNRLNAYKKTFYQMYLDSIYPVSREVFLINAEGLSVIGDLKSP